MRHFHGKLQQVMKSRRRFSNTPWWFLLTGTSFFSSLFIDMIRCTVHTHTWNIQQQQHMDGWTVFFVCLEMCSESLSSSFPQRHKINPPSQDGLKASYRYAVEDVKKSLLILTFLISGECCRYICV